jgi:hypothetical protein
MNKDKLCDIDVKNKTGLYEIPMFYQTPIDMKIKQQGIPFVL